MNILLVRPKPHKDTINLQSFMICEPLELEILSAALENEGHKVTIADMLLEKKNIVKVLPKNIDMVCFTAYIVHTGVVLDYAKSIKNFDKKIITVVGGVYAEVVPQDFLNDNIDYIICRRPVKTLTNIAGSRLDKIKGCVFSNDIDLIPFEIDTCPTYPDRLKTQKYRKHYNYVLHSHCASIKTSYGCPHNCEFCFCKVITGGKYACRQINDIMAEIKLIKENNVFIVDDNFLMSTDFVEQFCLALKENEIKKNFILFGRSDFISKNPSSIEILAKAGLKAVFVGIESFKKSELDCVDKRTTVEMNIKAIHVLESYGIESYMGLICRYDWVKEDFDNLIEYLNDFKHPFINLQPITPIPGTNLFEAEKNNIELERSRFHLWDMAHLCRTPENMTIKEFYKNILRVYFKTTASARMRKYIRKTYGIRVYLRTLWGAICIARQYRKLAKKNRINI